MTSPITIDDINDQLVGLGQWRKAAAESTPRLDDNRIMRLVPAWIRKFEMETTFWINRCQVVSAPDGTYDAGNAGPGTVTSTGRVITGTGTTFTSTFQPGQLIQVGKIAVPIFEIKNDLSMTLDDAPYPGWSNATYVQQPIPIVHEHGYPFYRRDSFEYFMTSLRKKPVFEVQRLRFMLNGQTVVLQIPPSWFSLDPLAGRFWLLPYNGEVAMSGLSQAMAVQSTQLYDYVPNFMFFDYQCGLDAGWQYTAEHSALRLSLAEWSAYQVLCIICQSIAAGMTSKTVGGAGISQSFQYDRFKGRKDELLASVKQFTDNFRAQYTPVMLSAI